MSAPNNNEDGRDKAFCLALEAYRAGDTHPLEEVLSKLAFDQRGLIPVVTQDSKSGDVLMLAWMNRDALSKTLQSGQMTYFSRSRNALWLKGETSGNYQWVEEVRIDCDGDAVLCRVRQEGSACHTERTSCFYLAIDMEQGTVRMTCSRPSDCSAK